MYMYLCCVTVEHLAKYLGMRIALEEEVKIENGKSQPVNRALIVMSTAG